MASAGVQSSCELRRTVKFRQGLFAALVVSIGPLAPAVVPTQEADKLEEVIVTAQKRTESLQDVPISVQVIGSQTLAERNHNTLEDLTQTVPAVHVSSSNSGNLLYIRGVGTVPNRSFDQSVAMFVDDIYLGRSRMSYSTFLDLDRIEVLKGPQSTFFGNNAIAGALNIVTKKPGNHFDAGARALYGEFGQYALEGAVGGPITDTFGARLAVTRNGDNRGWIDNVGTGEKVPRVNNLAGRLTLAFNPSKNLGATLKIEGGQHRLAGSFFDQPLQWTNCPPPAPLKPSFGGGCNIALATPGVPIGLDNNKTTGLAGEGNSFSSFEDVLTINYDTWGQTFTSVSGFYNYHSDANADFGHLPTAFFATGQTPEKYHQFSQELRVASPAGGQIEYLAGAYFQTDKLVSSAQLTFPVFNALFRPPSPLAPYRPFAGGYSFTQDEHVYSAFGSLTWNAMARLKISGGLRGSWVKKDTTGSVYYGTGTQLYGGFVPLPPTVAPFPVLGPPGTSQPLSRSDRAVMPSARIQYQLDPNAMVYLRYDRGFKAGGINGEKPLGKPTVILFDPEYVNAYELGLKSTWFDNTALLNLDVFRMDYKDLQVNDLVFQPSINAYIPEIRNAATSVSQGVEFEGQWAVTKEFRLGANAAYLDAHYVSYPNAAPWTLQTYCGQQSLAVYSATPQCAVFPYPVPAIADLSGHRTPYAPRWSGSLYATYSMLLPGGYRFTTELSPYFTSAYDDNVFAPSETIGSTLLFQQGRYVRLDARLAFGPTDGRWAIDVIGKNLTDRIIVTNPGLYNQSKEQPRNVAVQFRYRFQ